MIKEALQLLKTVRRTLIFIANTSNDASSRNVSREAVEWIDNFFLKHKLD